MLTKYHNHKLQTNPQHREEATGHLKLQEIRKTIKAKQPANLYLISRVFQHRGNHILKEATITRKNMLPIGTMFYALQVAPWRIENE